MISFQQRPTGSRMPIVIAVLMLAFATQALAQDPPKTDDEKAFYSIGTSIAVQLDRVKPISDRELNVLFQGIQDAINGKTLDAEQKEGAALVGAMLQKRQEQAIAIETAASEKFLEAEAKKKGAHKTASGLIYTEIRPGTGASPKPTDRVRVHYHGTLRDGTVFDSSVERGSPTEFPLNRVIPCWTEGVAMMKEGGKSRLVCPASIAYGNRSTGRIPAGAALAFDVELLEIVK